MTNAPTPETLKHLQDGKIDVGIISTPVINKCDFKMTPGRKIQDVFLAGKKFEYLKGGKLSYKELENMNMKFKGKKFLRTIVLIPWAMRMIVAGRAARWGFNGQYRTDEERFRALEEIQCQYRPHLSLSPAGTFLRTL